MESSAGDDNFLNYHSKIWHGLFVGALYSIPYSTLTKKMRNACMKRRDITNTKLEFTSAPMWFWHWLKMVPCFFLFFFIVCVIFFFFCMCLINKYTKSRTTLPTYTSEDPVITAYKYFSSTASWWILECFNTFSVEIHSCYFGWELKK